MKQPTNEIKNSRSSSADHVHQQIRARGHTTTDTHLTLNKQRTITIDDGNNSNKSTNTQQTNQAGSKEESLLGRMPLPPGR